MVWIRYQNNLVSKKGSDSVSKKCGIDKKYRIRYRKNLVSEKSFGFGFVQILGIVTHCSAPTLGNRWAAICTITRLPSAHATKKYILATIAYSYFDDLCTMSKSCQLGQKSNIQYLIVILVGNRLWDMYVVPLLRRINKNFHYGSWMRRWTRTQVIKYSGYQALKL